MSTKRLCDLCDEPALPITRRSKGYNTGKKFYIEADFRMREGTYESVKDPQGDICGKCLAEGLEAIAKELRSVQPVKPETPRAKT